MNIPADTIEIAGGLLDLAMNPWTSAKGLMGLLGTVGQGAIGAETVIELLKEKSKSVGSIFVITHNDTLKPFFDSVITVEKGKKGISHVIGG